MAEYCQGVRPLSIRTIRIVNQSISFWQAPARKAVVSGWKEVHLPESTILPLISPTELLVQTNP